MPLDDLPPEFRPLAPWPASLRFPPDGRTERILQNQLPPRPDARSYTGSTAALAADAEFADPAARISHRSGGREMPRGRDVSGPAAAAR
jgi:hypothetical protein